MPIIPKSGGTASTPNDPTEKAVVSPVAPNDPTEKPVVAVSVANDPTEKAVIPPGAPNTPIKQVAAGIPRAIQPILDLNFATDNFSQRRKSVLLKDLLTYSRSSSATFINRRFVNGKAEFFLDTDFVGTVDNLLTFTEHFNNAAWDKGFITVSPNAARSPVGDFTADRITDSVDTVVQSHLTEQELIFTAAEHTFSFYAKADGGTEINLIINDGTFGSNVTFDLAAGSIIGTLTTLPDDFSITPDVDGWFLLSGTFTTLAQTGNIKIKLIKNGVGSYVGDGTNSVFIWGAQLTQSNKRLPYVKNISSAVQKTFTETLRIEYDAATGKNLGALVEGSSTNLFVRTEEFDNVAWIKSGATITANDIIGPDGTRSADKFAASSTGLLSPNLNRSVAVVAGNNYTSSFFVRKAGIDFVQIFYDAGNVAGVPRANFNIKDVKLGTVDPEITADIKDVGDGWLRISSTALAAQAFTNTFLRLMKAGTDTRAQANSFTVGEGIHVFGAQIEKQATATSYIRTVASTVTRTGDVLSMSRFNTTLVTQNNSTYAKLDLVGLPDGTGHVWDINDTSAERRALSVLAGGVGGHRYGNVASFTTPFTAGVAIQAVITYDGANVKQYIDNVLITLGGPEPLVIGNADIVFGSSEIFFHLQRFSTYDETLTAQEVALL